MSKSKKVSKIPKTSSSKITSIEAPSSVDKKRRRGTNITNSSPQKPSQDSTIDENEDEEDDLITDDEANENLEDQKQVEVLSHKERRKRRKLSKQNPNETIPEPAPTPKPTRSRYGIWVGNMLYNTTQVDVEAFFSPCGSISRLHMPSGKKPGQNAGFAYIDFETPEAVEEALKKSESLLGGRKLLIKRSTDYTGRPTTKSLEANGLDKGAKKILNKQKQPPAACLFLGNLSFETTTESIMDLFRSNHLTNTEVDDVGIRQVRLGTFEDSGKCKGFGFVDFFSVQAATAALTNTKNYALLGRQLTLEYASADAVRRGGGARSAHPPSTTPKPRLPNSKSTRPSASRPGQPSISKALPPPLASVPPLEVKDSATSARKKEFLGRLTPGAALANARRAPTGIIKNPEKVGKKITFD
ncbi:hypothetical protein CROQUDRAFT_132214 [Cronartium quercuum f. sp. fusiforme G11]|uniref:RRM domain-containing protein n=1 Tax=Cronartium quercuum f. sp. fusiforme G11 TaxID=708437 RepID=A0A9P6NPH6_9BASI|nr:hypothetical protein CROQUDRAFT_132214 [Cronartium quercuum f. sp. fusiforme G11]